MKATTALFLDAYREMNAKRLFAVVLVLSVLIAVAFAAVRNTPDGVTVFGIHTFLDVGNNDSAPVFYKGVYVNLGVHLWLEWAAMILALISTAAIFPDFLATGSIELYLACPMSRLKLFFFKYFTGLFFVMLQVTLFSAASFLVIGIRGGAWEPGLLLAVPLATLLFSYLYSVCTLAGVLTRSTMAALLWTLTAWFIMGGAQIAEQNLREEQVLNQIQTARLDSQIEQIRQSLATEPATQEAQPGGDRPVGTDGRAADSSGLVSRFMRDFVTGMPMPTHGDRATIERQLETVRGQRASIDADYQLVDNLLFWIDAPLPKTSDTISLIERTLLPAVHVPERTTLPAADPRSFQQRRYDRNVAETTVTAEIRNRSAVWTIGTSLGFEAALVCAAAWVFCRRDY